VPAFLIYGDTERSAALRHEVPLAIADPFLLLHADGAPSPLIMTNMLERERIARALPDAELVLMNELGFLDLIRGGMPRPEAELEVVARAVERSGARSFAVPPELPVAVADRLRADGVTLTVDGELFEMRRRAKSPAELAGIRRAQTAAEAAMRAAAATLRDAEPRDGRLVSAADGSPLTAEQVRAAARDAAAAAGAPAPPDIMVTSAFSAGGHDPGAGPLPADLPVVVDLWPRDEDTGCWADMTRTFVRGAVTPEVETLRDVVRDALERVRAAARPGVTGRELYEIAAGVVEEAGHMTQRTAPPGETPMHGFYFSLGHGVGLELHEEPGLGLSGRSPLLVGDVIAVEPGIEGLPGIGGVRYEDLLLITEDGCETLTDYPYDLEP
jgi:Xaa-Pro aminopeptidase